MKHFKGLSAILCVVAMAFSAGCGERAAARVRVTGKVTFDGQPVPYGNITFEPDAAKGNQGPQGYAKINEGAFDSGVGGSGPCPGPQNVTIEGYPELGREKSGQARLTFTYQTTWDVSKNAATRDFAVPPTAGRREAASNVPPP